MNLARKWLYDRVFRLVLVGGNNVSTAEEALRELLEFESAKVSREILFCKLVPTCGDHKGHWCTDGTDGITPLPNKGFCQIHQAWAEATKEVMKLVGKVEAKLRK